MDTPSFIKEYFRGQEKNHFDRFLAFDICHDYFSKHRGNASSSKNLRESILVLWSYLGSWGMLRGRSYLHELNPFFLKDAISVIDKYSILYDIDVADYDELGKTIEVCYFDLRQALSLNNDKPTNTLVTKIMLGVFSCIPATDVNVSESLYAIYGKHPRTVRTILRATKLYYYINKTLFSPREIITLDWNGKEYKRTYNTIKLIDMHAFVEGKKLISEKMKEKHAS